MPLFEVGRLRKMSTSAQWVRLEDLFSMQIEWKHQNMQVLTLKIRSSRIVV